MKYRYNLIRSEWGWTLTESGYRLSMGETQRLREMLLTLRGAKMTLNYIYPRTSLMYSTWTGIRYETHTHAGGKLMTVRGAKSTRSYKKHSRIFKSLEKAELGQLPPSPQQQGDNYM